MAGSRTRLLMACKSEPRECPTRAVMASIDCERPTASALRVLRKASWRPGQRIAAAAIFTDQEDGGGKMAGRVGPSDGLGSTTVRMGTAADSDGLTFTTTRNAPRGDAGAPGGLAGSRIWKTKASALNYTLCAERKRVRIGYSYALYERGAKPVGALWRPNGAMYPRFVRLEARICGSGLTNEGNRAGVAQSVERQPSKSNAPERGALIVEFTHEMPISCQVKRCT
jgi:hypothetical protein